MPDPEKTKAALLDSTKDYSHRFADVVHFLGATGWKMRTKGSHHIFTRTGVLYPLNLQVEKSGKAKAYQIRQVRRVLQQFNL
ncbi:MAG TPA: hypothetical protein VG734_09920 [Lacunisphaera sp.]|nr:hypothetical protein [Lacunisphaera sp.]